MYSGYILLPNLHYKLTDTNVPRLSPCPCKTAGLIAQAAKHCLIFMAGCNARFDILFILPHIDE